MRKLVFLAALAALSACSLQRRKSDAELGLNPQQARGRHIFDRDCARCHEAYSSHALRGPSLQGIFKKQYLPSGTPANDARVREVITLGRSKMRGFGDVLTSEQVDDLIAYLHTL